MGFVPSKHLGKEMAYLQPYLQKLKELYGINICGEGGEYETLTLDCPLFTNARIVLDDFEVVLHSSDSIAPVGVLHPLAFHLENKGVIMPNGDDRINDASVWEVEDGDLDGPEGALCATCVTDSIKMTEHKYKLSRTKNTGAFSLCCWGQAPGERPTVESVQEDLEAVLRRIESQLAKYGFGWQNVLYIHLYIADMNDFTTANETYIKFITHERCEYGVPSRSTIELPLVQANLGRAYVEVFVANDNSKRVLHVQSISCWAPSCIGPYSQATLHKGVLYMAGQLGLDPPTMNLCKGGPAAELEQALKNSEAVAKCFNCSLATSAILFVIYCSKDIPPLEKIKIPEKLDAFLKELRSHESDNDGVLERLNPICLYVLVPNLPKGALVEVKPFLFVGEDVEITSRTVNNNCKILASDWGFQHADWHDSCIQRCVIHGKICAVFLSVTKEISAKMSSECLVDNQADRNGQISLERGEEMGNVARFTLYLLDKILMENDFSWADIMTLRFYFPTSLAIPLETLSHKFHIAFSQLAGTGRRIDLGAEPIFNLVPVLGAGSSSALMDDIISCELFAQKT